MWERKTSMFPVLDTNLWPDIYWSSRTLVLSGKWDLYINHMRDSNYMMGFLSSSFVLWLELKIQSFYYGGSDIWYVNSFHIGARTWLMNTDFYTLWLNIQIAIYKHSEQFYLITQFIVVQVNSVHFYIRPHEYSNSSK